MIRMETLSSGVLSHSTTAGELANPEPETTVTAHTHKTPTNLEVPPFDFGPRSLLPAQIVSAICRNVAGKIQSVVVLVAVRVPEANESTAT
jgi:hypothetical protein